MRRLAVPALLLILATACASTQNQRPDNFAQPDVRIEPIGGMFFGSGNSAPVTFEVEIANRAQSELRLREIEISSPGMSTYGIRPVRRYYNDVIQPGTSKALTIFTTAVTSVRDPGEPLTLRTIVTFEANGSRWREILQR